MRKEKLYTGCLLLMALITGSCSEEENPEVSSCPPCRSYTTIPSDSPVPEDEKHIEESEEDASEKETPSDNSED